MSDLMDMARRMAGKNDDDIPALVKRRTTALIKAVNEVLKYNTQHGACGGNDPQHAHYRVSPKLMQNLAQAVQKLEDIR